MAGGLGVPQDYTEAVKWFKLSAEQGYAGGQYNLGVMYANGWRVPQDYVQAHKWFTLSEANGYKCGGKYRYMIEKIMTQEQIASAQRLAKEWMDKHRKD